MTGEIFLEAFFSSISDLYDKGKWDQRVHISDPVWTSFMERVIGDVSAKLKCYPAMRSQDKEANRESYEYLTIDAMLFDLGKYKNDNQDPLIIPSLILEHENDDKHKRIKYCLWKLLMVRSPIRVLICYQGDQSKIKDLISELAGTVIDGQLMESERGELLVLIGNQDYKEDDTWKDYFTVLRWQGSGFKTV
jgi:hypothetical protein